MIHSLAMMLSLQIKMCKLQSPPKEPHRLRCKPFVLFCGIYSNQKMAALSLRARPHEWCLSLVALFLEGRGFYLTDTAGSLAELVTEAA